ncbi:MAG: DUF5009 domain-containing protein, partial [Gemmatimonadota bacterium]|nr:DUF5009 domain-containing protein [Gemmatimonadota bacterium]
MDTPTGRLISLDAFRGITIAGMILVNNPGSWSHVYPPLLHAEWHGWTPTDLIFPFFLFIVGVAITFSVVRRLEAGDNRRDILAKVAKRSAIIVGLGLFLSAFPRFNVFEMRFPGVLQRIGLVYLATSFLVLYLNRRSQLWVATGILLGYWALMTLVPVPGYGPGDLSADGNLGAFLDRLIFGTHLWRDNWDPEGLLSTLPAIATALSGVFTGYLLRSGKNSVFVVGAMFTAGWAAIIAGIIWGLVFPINKALWTSSYVLFTTGAALQFLAICYWLIDIQGIKRWAYPAVVFGMNSIAVFVLSGLFVKTIVNIRWEVSGETTSLYAWIYNTMFVPWAGPLNGSLLFAVGNILLWY